jgi:hypothetical protein
MYIYIYIYIYCLQFNRRRCEMIFNTSEEITALPILPLYWRTSYVIVQLKSNSRVWRYVTVYFLSTDISLTAPVV